MRLRVKFLYEQYIHICEPIKQISHLNNLGCDISFDYDNDSQYKCHNIHGIVKQIIENTEINTKMFFIVVCFNNRKCCSLWAYVLAI